MATTKEYIIEITVDQKKANQALKESKKELQDVRNGFAGLATGTKEYNDQIEKLTASTKKFTETASLAELKAEYNKLNREIGKLVPGTADYIRATTQLAVVKQRYTEVRTEIANVGKETAETAKETAELNSLDLGELKTKFAEAFLTARANGDGFFTSLRAGFSSISAALSGAGPLGVLLTVIGGLALVAKTVADVTVEFTKLRTEAANLTGLTGEALNQVVTSAKGIADTFGGEYTDVLRSANTLANEFGITQKEALDLIGEGFINGANASGEFLDQLREYPAQLREAGYTAQDTIDIINATGKAGIFSDKGIDTIKEANLKLKDGNKATIEALNVIGLNGEAIQKALQDGSQTTKDVLADVGKAIAKLPENSAVAQKAISDIFGGPGEDAGRRFIESLANIGSATQNLTSNTDDLRQRQRDQLEANTQLAESQNRISLQFESSTSAISLYTTQIKSFAFNALAGVVDFFAFFGDNLTILTTRFKEAGNNAIDAINTVLPSAIELPKFKIDVSSLELQRQLAAKKNQEYNRLEEERQTKADTAAEKAALKAAQARQKAITDTAKQTAKVLDEIEKGSIAALQKQIAEVEKKINNSNPKVAVTLLPKLAELKAELERAKLEIKGIKVDLINAVQQATLTDGLEPIPIEVVPTIAADASPVVDDLAEKLRQSIENRNFDAAKSVQDAADKETEAQQRLDKYDEQIAKINLIKDATNQTAQGFEQLANSIGASTAAGKLFIIVARAAAVASQVAAVAAGIQAIAKAATQPFPASLIAIATTAAALGGAIASVRQLIQAFAIGGEVQPISGQRVANRRNIPTQPNGDSVLAMLTPGEVVLNAQQQQRLQSYFGGDVWQRIGVPGFATGGVIGGIPITNAVQQATNNANANGNNNNLLPALQILIALQQQGNEKLEALRTTPTQAYFTPTEYEAASKYVTDLAERKKIK